MSVKGFVGFNRTALVAAMVLSVYAVSAFQEGTTELTECTPQEIARCYSQYVTNFYSYSPPYDSSDKTFSEDTYNQVCSAFNETSSCYAGFERCPHSMKVNFTRREEGYRAFRALACDRGAYQAVLTMRQCVDPQRMAKCIDGEHGGYKFDGNYKKFFCTYSLTHKMCFKRAWNSSCGLSLETRQITITRVMDAEELIHDCERMYQRASTPHSTNIAASDTEALSKLLVEVAELKRLQRKALQTLYSLLEKVEAMEEADKQKLRANSNIADQQ